MPRDVPPPESVPSQEELAARYKDDPRVPEVMRGFLHKRLMLPFPIDLRIIRTKGAAAPGGGEWTGEGVEISHAASHSRDGGGGQGGGGASGGEGRSNNHDNGGTSGRGSGSGDGGGGAAAAEEEPWLAPLIGGSEATEPRAAAEPRQLAWIKAPPLGDDPTLHLCVAAYSSDFALLETTLLPHRKTIPSPEIQAASLDHSMWRGRS